MASADLSVDGYKSAVDNACRTWPGSAAKLKNDAARRDKIEAVNLELSTNISTYDFPENVTEDDVRSVVSKLRSCLEKAGKDVFGQGVSVIIQERHNLKKGAPRILDITSVKVNW